MLIAILNGLIQVVSVFLVVACFFEDIEGLIAGNFKR